MNMLQHAIVISLHGHMWIHVELIRYGLDLVYTQERASMFAWQICGQLGVLGADKSAVNKMAISA
jgi:hypothetical protein